MRIVIDLQGAQSASRFRGIGRYSMGLALGVARNAGSHEVWIVLNSALPEAIAAIRTAFEGLVPQERIRVFDPVTPAAEYAPDNQWRARINEQVREYLIGQLQPDAVLVTSLFEGYVDDTACAVGAFTHGRETAVVLYDLIPFLNPQAYLATAVQQQYYARKIESLRKAGLLLAISDYSRQEAIGALGLDPARVVAISTAVDQRFHPAAADPVRLEALRARFGIRRKAIMYAPGGFDARKNIDGLITAYGMLPPALRAEHQLLIASKLEAGERDRLQQHGRRRGLAADELLFTDYVDDDTLVGLYRAAHLFVFPSKHEGFGLPALEAMACGALVIGGNNSSLPEVIGCEEAMFDAADPAAIAAKMAEVLADPHLQERLGAHGKTQAAKFSWDASAQRALRALEAHAARSRPAAPRTRRRLAFVSPLPPERTGIADYAAQCLPALMEYFDIELVLHQPQVSLPPALAALPRRDIAWFEQHPGDYDQIIYQFGNSPFHSHMFGLLERHPGVVVLHDSYLSSVLAYEQMTGAMPGAWTDALYHSHGYAALQAALSPGGAEQAKLDYPCNLAVLQGARAVIVHSAHALQLARQWYGPGAERGWHVVPLPRSAPAARDREQARTALGIAPDAFVVCSFGFVDSTKLSDRLLEAWLASTLRNEANCELVFVGANHGGAYGQQLLETINGAGAHKRIRIAGWSDEQVYHRYLQAADVGVQLRSVSRGETSAAVLDCMNYGLATIVNASGSMAALDDDAVWKLRFDFATGELVEALETLRRDSTRLAALGARAASAIARHHRPEHSARQYAEVLDAVWRDMPTDMHALVRAVAAVMPAGEQSLQQVAHCLSFLPHRYPQPRQLLVDVTNIVRNDLGTGIERVVRMQLLELLRHPATGYRVEPVYLSTEGGRWHYRYAQHYARKVLGMEAMPGHEPAVDINPGDVFYAPDYAPSATIEAARAGIYASWRARGVSVNFLIHDLLPVLRPEFFPPGVDASHAAWLACIAQNADRLVCISGAVAQETREWLAAQPQAGVRRPEFRVVHHGADIGAPSVATSTQPLAPVLTQLAAAPSFLMVGTIEPRKGHLQALAAFEQLWREGAQLNLVIVGHEGWKPLAAAERRTIPQIVAALEHHPELGKRLFWLKGIDDAMLQQVYQASVCLLAPSEGEGFGLPLIEAARCGLPVIARDIPVFREVAGGGAFYFSGMEGASLAEAVRAWLELHADGVHPAPSGMKWNTWQQNAEALMAILRAPARPLTLT
jgi:glycosyltransferase involved in cell wall biosynthesis